LQELDKWYTQQHTWGNSA